MQSAMCFTGFKEVRNMKKAFLALSLCAVVFSGSVVMAAEALVDEVLTEVEEVVEAAEEAVNEVEEAASEAAAEAAELMEAIPEGVEVDDVASASVMDFYGDFGISGDDLMNAVNSYTGSYVVSTVNEDGTPQVGFYIYSMVKDEETGTYYVLLGLAANQTRVNLERTKEAMALYAANPEADAEEQYAKAGARMQLKLVEDEELAAKINTTGYDTTMVCEVVSERSLG